jgi:hypothetical protein
MLSERKDPNGPEIGKLTQGPADFEFFLTDRLLPQGSPKTGHVGSAENRP